MRRRSRRFKECKDAEEVVGTKGSEMKGFLPRAKRELSFPGVTRARKIAAISVLRGYILTSSSW